MHALHWACHCIEQAKKPVRTQRNVLHFVLEGMWVLADKGELRAAEALLSLTNDELRWCVNGCVSS